MAKKKSTLDSKIEEALTHLTPTEKQEWLKNLSTEKDRGVKTYKHYFGRKHIKFGLLGDLHVGHKAFREDLFLKATQDFERRGIKNVYQVGDLCEGMSGRDGHIYELTHVGATKQMDYLEDLIGSAPNLKFNAIIGNHDGWYMWKGNMGLNIGKEMDKRLKNFKYLGFMESDIMLNNKIKMKLVHPHDGSAYAISYKIQKRVEGLDGGNKPHIFIEGHYHKALYTFIRNVHCMEAGTLSEQTPFMKGKNIPAHLGYWVVDMTLKDNEIESFKPEFVPGFVKPKQYLNAKDYMR